MTRAPLFALALALGGTLPAAAEASCVAPDFEVVWSYPAQGQTNVPTNAQVVVLTTQWSSVEAQLDGATLVQEAEGFRFATPVLAANTEHTLVLTPNNFSGGAPVTLTFRTGAGPMASKPPAAEPGQTVESGERTLDAVCSRALAAGDCYDTGQDEYLTLRTTHLPVAWIVRFLDESGRVFWRQLWPGTCGSPEVFVHSNDDRCYTLMAVNEIGETAAPVRYCHAPPLVPAAGCGVPGGTWPALGIALAALGVVRRRTRGK